MPVTPPTGTESSWVRLWPTNISDRMSLTDLIELINRRFRGMPSPPVMTSSVSRSIWNDVNQKMDLPDLIRLLNRRLGGIRLPMNPGALVNATATSPYGNENIIIAGQIDQSFHIGNGVIFSTGTHGNAWIPKIKRYVRRIQATAGGGGGYYRLNEQLEPRAIIDPRYGALGWRLRARECLALSFTNGLAPAAGVAYSAQAIWGFFGMPNALSTANTIFAPGVGFKARYDRTAGGVVSNTPNWHCVVWNDQCVALYDHDTGIDCQDPREFQLDFDAPTNTVFFYINGVQVGSYTFATNTAPGQVTPYVGGGAPTAAGAWNMVYASNNTGSATFVTEFCYHMDPATPLITFEFADA